MELKAIDINHTLSTLKHMVDRTPESTTEDAEDVFAELFSFNNGAVFAGSFTGYSEWERHRNGDEIVHVIAGETDLTIMKDDGPETLNLSAGSITVVPVGHWHRFRSSSGVSFLTAAPQPTGHAIVDDPRTLLED